MAVDEKKHEITDEYIASQGERGDLIRENILTWRRMLKALHSRSAERDRRGDSMVKYNPAAGRGRVIAELAECEDGIIQAELAARINVTPQTLGAHLAKLEESGLVERKRSKSDGSARLVVLTSKGQEVARLLDEEDKYSGSMFEAFTADELVQLEMLMSKLAAHLEAEYAAMKAYDAVLGDKKKL